MQAPKNSCGCVGSSADCGSASHCVASSTSGTSSRYRFTRPIRRQARSLGAGFKEAALAGMGTLEYALCASRVPRMNLHEYQAKDIFRSYGIPVPDGHVAANVEEAVAAAKK